MRRRLFQIAFTPSVREAQAANGSCASYARFESDAEQHDGLGEAEAAFIGARYSVYMATVSETGWPHLQHRGGLPGFVKVLGRRCWGWPTPAATASISASATCR